MTNYNPRYEEPVTREKILEFTCPECLAKPGTLCIETKGSRQGNPRKPYKRSGVVPSHQRRMYAAQDHQKPESAKRDKGNWYGER